MHMIDTQHFKEMLESEKMVLEKELATVARKNPDQKGDWEATENDGDKDTADEAEVADSMEMFERNQAVTNELEIRLQEVNDALSRIEDGTYGTCVFSGKQIELERLEANPAAKTCIAHMND